MVSCSMIERCSVQDRQVTNNIISLIYLRPRVSPTIVDAIFGGAIFMAPPGQFMSMEMHPLFIDTEKSFKNPEEQANKIISILHGGERKQLRFGGYNNTSYTLEHACERLLEVIQRSFSDS